MRPEMQAPAAFFPPQQTQPPLADVSVPDRLPSALALHHCRHKTPDQSVCVCVCVSERERVCVCVCVCERERECVCVCERERERERVCVCVSE